ncbi:beta-ketoacyl synthase N-terminal-like domain-containing protein [Christiangramia salexigens]|uniref:Beta-ketoacyl synthase n=1 Tax=Christiangramia salexigens TaxID=1913577 RepID=A0A1L3J305_9FLAO|nr:beta-ketoacyl synthase N-terminal-like domain-containing protein [Christiangramia salexigens]APG59505.1 beta-ketoacyl synthase [Christiangramia salexigens]
MKKNFLLTDSIISPIGFGTFENINAIRSGRSALQFHERDGFEKGCYAGLIPESLIDLSFQELGDIDSYTKLEKMIILSIDQVLEENPGLDLESTGLILATTKGNIDLLRKNDFSSERLFLWNMAETIAEFFGFIQKPIVVSNACVSGSLAIRTANDLINSGRFSKVIVAGGDLVSDFVLSGFQSFQAISPEPCRPFSDDRKGISLGEAAAAVLIGSSDDITEEGIAYIDGVSANDANHISGPSRNGEGLYLSIKKLLQRNDIKPAQIDYLSAHGTATTYNDDMESIAFHRAGLSEVPVNSFKAYYGHSLGASALIESILTKHSLLNNELLRSLNFTTSGTSEKLNIIEENRSEDLNFALKTASGFGGGNLAIFLKKERL